MEWLFAQVVGTARLGYALCTMFNFQVILTTVYRFGHNSSFNTLVVAFACLLYFLFSPPTLPRLLSSLVLHVDICHLYSPLSTVSPAGRFLSADAFESVVTGYP